MTINVIMPVFNGSRYLREALASVLAQRADFTLTISDDNSTDDSVEIINSFHDDRINLIRNSENAGIFRNINRCIRYANFEYIQIFSQDDIMLQGFLESQKNLLESYPDAGMVYGTPEYINEHGAITPNTIFDPTPTYINWPLYKWISSHYGSISSSISSVMLHRSVLQTIGVFSEEYPLSGDLEFYNRVAREFPILRNADVLHQVRGHAEMTSALASSGPNYLAEEIRLEPEIRKWWSEKDWEDVRRFRAYSRGLSHLGWIKRRALKGELLMAAQNYRRLARMFPQSALLRHLLMRVLKNTYRPSPKIPIPDVKQES